MSIKPNFDEHALATMNSFGYGLTAGHAMVVRDLMSLRPWAFARILGVDHKTVINWETPGTKIQGSYARMLWLVAIDRHPDISDWSVAGLLAKACERDPRTVEQPRAKLPPLPRRLETPIPYSYEIPSWRVAQSLHHMGLSQVQLARLMNVTQQTASRWVNGDRGLRGLNAKLFWMLAMSADLHSKLSVRTVLERMQTVDDTDPAFLDPSRSYILDTAPNTPYI